MLGKVQLPLSRRMILLGVNQTILFALSMVVIAGLIGGGGLGDVVTSGLYSNPALAILAGVVIVILAMALDRSPRRSPTAPTPRIVTSTKRRRSADCGSTTLRSRSLGTVGRRQALGEAHFRTRRRSTPRPRQRRNGCSRRSRRARLRAGPDHVGLQDHRAHLGTSSSGAPAEPLQQFLIEAPWFTTVGGLTCSSHSS